MNIMHIKKTMPVIPMVVIALAVLAGTQCYGAAADEVKIDQKELNHEFRQAAKKGNAPEVMRLLASKADVNATDRDGMSALKYAFKNNCENSHDETITLLFAHGAVNELESLSVLASRAAVASREVMLKSEFLNVPPLAQQYIDLATHMQKWKNSPLKALHYAVDFGSKLGQKKAEENSEEIINRFRGIVALILKEYTMQLTAADYTRALYQCAATNGDIYIAKQLLSIPGVIVDEENYEAVVMAAEHGYTELLELLLKAALIDVRVKERALCGAAKHGSVDCVSLLLKNGVDIRGVEGDALCGASAFGSIATVDLLLKNGAQVGRAINGNGSTPLISAIRRSLRYKIAVGIRFALVEMLLKAGAMETINAVDGNGKTALITAVKDAVRCGDDVNVRRERLAIIQALLDAGAAVNDEIRDRLVELGFALLRQGFQPSPSQKKL